MQRPESGSPIDCLVPSLAASPFSVAPERPDAHRQIVLASGISIDIHVDRDDSLLEVVPPSTILIGLPFAERLWGYCYGYCGLMAFLEARGSEHGEVLLPASAP